VREGRYNIFDEADLLRPETEKLWAQRQATLNATADRVADAYDEFIRLAQDKLHIS
jgi:hypothetical protein